MLSGGAKTGIEIKAINQNITQQFTDIRYWINKEGYLHNPPNIGEEEKRRPIPACLLEKYNSIFMIQSPSSLTFRYQLIYCYLYEYTRFKSIAICNQIHCHLLFATNTNSSAIIFAQQALCNSHLLSSSVFYRVPGAEI